MYKNGKIKNNFLNLFYIHLNKIFYRSLHKFLHFLNLINKIYIYFGSIWFFKITFLHSLITSYVYFKLIWSFLNLFALLLKILYELQLTITHNSLIFLILEITTENRITFVKTFEYLFIDILKYYIYICLIFRFLA
jgi:hypothetical protein